MGVQMIIDLDSQRPAGLDPVSYLSGYREGCANRPAMRSKAHRVIVRYGPATFIIVACVGLVLAAPAGPERRCGESGGGPAMDEATGRMAGDQRPTAETVGRGEARAPSYKGVIRIAAESVPNGPKPAVAAALQSGVRPRDLPAGMAQE